jgi:hypothetical protein
MGQDDVNVSIAAAAGRLKRGALAVLGDGRIDLECEVQRSAAILSRDERRRARAYGVKERLQLKPQRLTGIYRNLPQTKSCGGMDSRCGRSG